MNPKQLQFWPDTIRFWHYINGSPVKLTLHDGQTIDHYHSEPTDEGYSYSGVSLSYDADSRAVYFESSSGGRDCDGRIDHYGDLVCPIGKLDANERILKRKHDTIDGEILAFPDWEKISVWQRDHSAEAMGY